MFKSYELMEYWKTNTDIFTLHEIEKYYLDNMTAIDQSFSCWLYDMEKQDLIKKIK